MFYCFCVSPAIDVAVKQVNEDGLLPDGYRMTYEMGETYGSETESISKTVELIWQKNVSAIIGPQTETCKHEARIAASFNIPMISHYCSQVDTSNKLLYPTFARTIPSHRLVTNSVVTVVKT